MIYLDNAGTTKPHKKITELLIDLHENFYFNPSAGYEKARKTKALIESARNSVAKCVNAKPENVIFTSCATEANNQIIKSNVDSNKKNEYIFSQGEHPSVYNVALDLKNNGYIVHFIPLKANGSIDEDLLLKTINNNTKFVSIMFVSNETGAINDIENLVKKIKEKNQKIYIHSDCVQALGKISINFKKLNIDAITISSHKINGTKGAGALVCKNPEKLKPFILGGGQENNLRSGTENVDSICAFGMACDLIDIKNQFLIQEMSDYIKLFLKEQLGEEIIIVSGENCIPHTISIIFKKLKGEVFVRYLDGFGVVCSKGSACSTKKSGNRILESMGFNQDFIVGNVRLSLGVYNTFDEIKTACNLIVEKYRELKERMRL